jgi:hypothetical protein
MDETSRYSALAAAAEAHAHLASARKQIIGQRLPLAGTQCDLDKAVADLRVARRKVEEALQALETGQIQTQSD